MIETPGANLREKFEKSKRPKSGGCSNTACSVRSERNTLAEIIIC